MSRISSQIPSAANSKISGHHSFYEISAYFSIILLIILYMIYQVYKVGEDYFDEYFLDLYNDFTPGWFYRRKDVSDAEWVIGTKVIKILLPILFVHIIVSELLKNCGHPNLIQLWHIVTGIAFILKYLGNYALILFLIQPSVFYLVTQLVNRKIIWITSVILLILQHKVSDLPNTESSEEDLEAKEKLDIIIVSLAWTNLRCLNFFLDALENESLRKVSLKNLMKLFSYIFYLPLLYHGPIVLYSDFRSSKWYSFNTKQTLLSTRIKSGAVQILRYIFWWLILELIFHFLYANAMLYHGDLLKTMNYYALFGVGYILGHIFHLKYVVFYGLTCCLTKFELECPVPLHPRCISRIYLYSDMWKHFDRGLYKFMVKYIYKPCVKPAGRLLASFVCFSFAFIWHGLYPHILIWTLLNYIGIAFEAFAKQLTTVNDFEKSYFREMSDQMYRRVKCIVAAPLLFMSSIAFIYYHCGKEIGDIFVQRMVLGNFVTVTITLIVFYCFCQVCTELDIKEKFTLINCMEPVKYNIQEKELLKKKYTLANNYQYAYNNKLLGTNFDKLKRLKKHRSTGQINIYSTNICHNEQKRNETLRHRFPIDNTSRSLGYGNYECNIGQITPMSFIEEYIQAKSTNPTVLSTNSNPSSTKNESNTNRSELGMENDVLLYEDKHCDNPPVLDPNKNKKKPLFSRIDMLYKSKFNKEKKRKLWNLDRKNFE